MPEAVEKSRILIARALPDEAIALARAAADVDYHAEDRPLARPELLRRLAGRQGVVSLITERIDGELLAACPGLRVVCNVAVGYDNVDVGACTARGVVVTNTPDVLTETTADFAWALLMATARHVVEGDRFVREGRFSHWQYLLLLGGDVHGKTLGIVGLGRIGRAMARRAQGFGMRILYHDEAPAVDLQDLRATRADLDTLLLTQTRHLINAERLRRMKRTAYLVNASRGPVVDEAALVQALREGWIAGAGLDVFEEEPKVHPGLLGLSNVVLAPHIASASSATRLEMATLAVRNCLAVLAGQPPISPVNPEVLKRR